VLKSGHFWIIICACVPILHQFATGQLTAIATIGIIVAVATGMHAIAIKKQLEKNNKLRL